MLDLDDFKSINDRFGHLVGDQVLQQSAQHIAACLQPEMILARYGGEEFVVLALAWRRSGWRRRWSECGWCWRRLVWMAAGGLAQTVSIGVAGRPEEGGASRRLAAGGRRPVFGQAAGRNRVRVWREDRQA